MMKVITEMIALHRVPEPDPPGLSAALDQQVSEQLWKITLHNFPPNGTGALVPAEWELYGWELVVLSHAPGYVWTATSLEQFVHPANAIYLIGPDSRSLEPEDIPEQLQELRRHSVHIRTDSPHSIFGHVAWALVYWDRKMKATS